MDIYQLVALPFSPSIRVRVGPRVDDVVEVDADAFEKQREQIKAYCLSLPDADGASWRTLRSHTGGNSTMAKLLIALGDLVGAWKIHPNPAQPELWYRSHMLPMVLAGSVARPVKSRVPKPSSGDLEKGTKACTCCGRPMGPPNSRIHDLQESAERPKTCLECDLSGCEDGEPCTLDGVDAMPLRKEAEEDLEAPDHASIEEYLKGLN